MFAFNLGSVRRSACETDQSSQLVDRDRLTEWFPAAEDGEQKHRHTESPLLYAISECAQCLYLCWAVVSHVQDYTGTGFRHRSSYMKRMRKCSNYQKASCASQPRHPHKGRGQMYPEHMDWSFRSVTSQQLVAVLIIHWLFGVCRTLLQLYYTNMCARCVGTRWTVIKTILDGGKWQQQQC